jgi:hypothetical protein
MIVNFIEKGNGYSYKARGREVRRLAVYLHLRFEIKISIVCKFDIIREEKTKRTHNIN